MPTLMAGGETEARDGSNDLPKAKRAELRLTLAPVWQTTQDGFCPLHTASLVSITSN